MHPESQIYCYRIDFIHFIQPGQSIKQLLFTFVWQKYFLNGEERVYDLALLQQEDKEEVLNTKEVRYASMFSFLKPL